MSFKLKIIVALFFEVLTARLIRSKHGFRMIRRIRRRNFIKNTLPKSEFYSKYEDFDDLPLGNKKLLMDNFQKINVLGIGSDEAFQVGIEAERGHRKDSMIDSVTVGLSSGTSGNRGIFLVSESERAAWVAAVLVRVIGVSLKQRKVAFFLRANSELYESVRSNLLAFQYFNIFQPMETHWEELLRLKPSIIVAQPSVIIELIIQSERDYIPWSIEKIISVAEVLTPKDEQIISTWAGIKVDKVYQCTKGFLAHTCSKGNLHWNSDFILVEKEWLNEDQYIPRITDLKRTTQPIVRYAMNDVITKGECSCALKSEVIGSIDGRMDDVFKWETSEETITIFPDFLRRTVAFSNPKISDYQIIKRNQDIFLWILGAEESYEAAESALTQLFLKKGVSTELHKIKQPYAASNGKKKRVINFD